MDKSRDIAEGLSHKEFNKQTCGVAVRGHLSIGVGAGGDRGIGPPLSGLGG